MPLLRNFFLTFYWNPLIWTKWRLWLFSRSLNCINCKNWSGIIFEWSRHHFCTKIGLILKMICCTVLMTLPSCFSSNFIKGWSTFAKILHLSKMGEITLTIISKEGFFTQFIKVTWFGRNDSYSSFQNRRYRTSLFHFWVLWSPFLYRT